MNKQIKLHKHILITKQTHQYFNSETDKSENKQIKFHKHILITNQTHQCFNSKLTNQRYPYEHADKIL